MSVCIVESLQNETQAAEQRFNLDLNLEVGLPAGNDEQMPSSNDNRQQPPIPDHNIRQSESVDIRNKDNITANNSDHTKTSQDRVGSSRTPPCPVGFIRHKNSCYHIIGSSELTWSIANTYCQLHKSKLVEVNSESEQRFLESMIKANNGKYRQEIQNC